MLEDVVHQLQPALTTLLVTLAIGVLGFVGHAIVVLRAKGTAWLDGLSADQRWKASVAKLDEAAGAAARAAEQTIASRLRAIEPVGKLTAAQAGQVMEEALAAARLHLGPATWNDIAATLELTPARLGDLLRTRIEAAVQGLKVGRLGAAVLTSVEEAMPASEAPTARETIASFAASESGELLSGKPR